MIKNYLQGTILSFMNFTASGIGFMHDWNEVVSIATGLVGAFISAMTGLKYFYDAQYRKEETRKLRIANDQAEGNKTT